MGEKISPEEGVALVKLARKAVKHFFEKQGKLRVEKLRFGKRGVFVTLETFPEKNLRGCIGYPLPVMPLDEAVVESALNAAFGDPRFPPLEENELEKIIFEVSILTLPEKIEADSPKDFLKKIELGRDGLILECGGRSGLLLPQVATEHNLSCEEFLSHLCMKAGLLWDTWTHEKVSVSKFHAQVFCEEKPGGKVVEKTKP